MAKFAHEQENYIMVIKINQHNSRI